MSTLTGTRRELGLDRECHSSARIRAFAHSRGNAIWMFGDARERDAGDAETRERHVWDVFLGGRARERRRRVVVDASERADDDGPSTGRRRLVDRVERRGCQSETICSYGLESGVWSLARERERERDEMTSD